MASTPHPTNLADAAFVGRALGLPPDKLIGEPGTAKLMADLRREDPPLTSIGPSGIGGEYQSETHPDRSEADLAAEREMLRSGVATPEEIGLLRHLAMRAVGGVLGGWERFEAKLNRMFALRGGRR